MYKIDDVRAKVMAEAAEAAKAFNVSAAIQSGANLNG